MLVSEVLSINELPDRISAVSQIWLVDNHVAWLIWLLASFCTSYYQD